jgi:uncharacterized coiled-coil protein SlyX
VSDEEKQQLIAAYKKCDGDFEKIARSPEYVSKRAERLKLFFEKVKQVQPFFNAYNACDGNFKDMAELPENVEKSAKYLEFLYKRITQGQTQKTNSESEAEGQAPEKPESETEEPAAPEPVARKRVARKAKLD